MFAIAGLNTLAKIVCVCIQINPADAPHDKSCTVQVYPGGRCSAERSVAECVASVCRNLDVIATAVGCCDVRHWICNDSRHCSTDTRSESTVSLTS